jgi:hypothetical protein
MTPAKARALLHQCPGGCGRPVSNARLTCPACWRLIPAPLRAAVWAAWRNGDGAGTPAHQAAITAAISSLGASS